jgi:signal transduction histidine kinase
MHTNAILKLSSNFPARASAGQALRDAGFEVEEAQSWEEVRDRVLKGEADMVVCDRDTVRAMEAGKAPATALPRDVARTIAHELRTPLSAMAGWLHLIETGKLDEAGLKRAIGKLRGNIDDQVRTIERHLGASQEGPR